MTYLAAGAGAAEILLFIPSDRNILGDSPMVERLLILRVAFMALCFGVMALIRLGRPRNSDWLLLCWAIAAIRPPQSAGRVQPNSSPVMLFSRLFRFSLGT